MRSLNLEGIEGKTDVTRSRLKVIAKYIDLFEFLFACSFIEQRLIHAILGVGERTVERWIHDILNDPYGKDLITKTKDGRITRIHLTTAFYTTIAKGDRFNNKRISKGKRLNAILRGLKYRYYNLNSNKELIDYLTKNNATKETYFINSNNKNHKILWEEKTFDYLEAINWTGLDNLAVDDSTISIDSIFCCDGTNPIEIVEAYAKVLTLMEFLKSIDFKECMDKNIEINFTVITLERVNIRKYIHLAQNYTREYDKNKMYHMFINHNRGKRAFFGYYTKTCPQRTKFVLFSQELQEFIPY